MSFEQIMIYSWVVFRVVKVFETRNRWSHCRIVFHVCYALGHVLFDSIAQALRTYVPWITPRICKWDFFALRPLFLRLVVGYFGMYRLFISLLLLHRNGGKTLHKWANLSLSDICIYSIHILPLFSCGFDTIILHVRIAYRI